jgi:hypothetical protein
MNRRVVVAVGLLVAACATPSQPSTGGGISTAIQVPAGPDFELAVGQEAKVDGTSIRIRFDGVKQDSRCPQEVQCVWAGNAVVDLRITSANTSVTLNTGIEPRSAGIDSYNITLVDVKPAAKQGGLPAGEYRAVLKVSPR